MPEEQNGRSYLAGAVGVSRKVRDFSRGTWERNWGVRLFAYVFVATAALAMVFHCVLAPYPYPAVAQSIMVMVGLMMGAALRPIFIRMGGDAELLAKWAEPERPTPDTASERKISHLRARLRRVLRFARDVADGVPPADPLEGRMAGAGVVPDGEAGRLTREAYGIPAEGATNGTEGDKH